MRILCFAFSEMLGFTVERSVALSFSILAYVLIPRFRPGGLLFKGCCEPEDGPFAFFAFQADLADHHLGRLQMWHPAENL